MREDIFMMEYESDERRSRKQTRHIAVYKRLWREAPENRLAQSRDEEVRKNAAKAGVFHAGKKNSAGKTANPEQIHEIPKEHRENRHVV